MMQLLYPALCLHCGCRVFSGKHFCEGCALFFQLLDVEERSCALMSASALDYVGAVCSFIQLVKKGFLTRLACCFLLLQFAKLGWELPDLIVLPPSGGKQQFASLFARKLGIALHRGLKRKWGRMPQERLPLEERRYLSGADFTFKGDVEGKKVLLIDDLIVTGATIRAAIYHLYGAEKIYVLTLSRMTIPSQLPAPPR